MNKELEEAKEYLEHEIKVYENNKEINRIIGGKVGERQHKINKIVLNYIDNSIPKEVVEKTIEELNNEEKEIYKKDIGNNELYRLKIIDEKRNVLQELLTKKRPH